MQIAFKGSENNFRKTVSAGHYAHTLAIRIRLGDVCISMISHE